MLTNIKKIWKHSLCEYLLISKRLMLLWLSYLFSFYRTRKEYKKKSVHSEYKKVDIAHVYWRIQYIYDTFEVFTCTANLFVFSLLINF